MVFSTCFLPTDSIYGSVLYSFNKNGMIPAKENHDVVFGHNTSTLSNHLATILAHYQLNVLDSVMPSIP